MAERDERYHGRKGTVREVSGPNCVGVSEKGVDMPDPRETLKQQLSRNSEITISVTGRKSGRIISNPVWFVAEGDTLYLLPVKGSDTQWYKNALENPALGIEAGGVEAEVKATPVSETKEVSAVVEKFRKKYGPGDVKKYYTKFDVAMTARLA